jgi:predicted nucleic acid-binding Zn ribbon protein
MRRKSTQTIGEVLHEYINAMSMQRKLKESRIEKIWENLLGKNAASLTRKVYIKDGILFAHLSSSVLRNEILMMRETLIGKINESAGDEIVTKIVLR